MEENSQGPVQPLESSPSVGRGILDSLIGGGKDKAGATSTAYQEPIPQQAAFAATSCPNCLAAVGKDVELDAQGVCGDCGFSKNERLI